MELAGAEDAMFMHVPEAPAAFDAHRKRKHDDLCGHIVEEAKNLLPRELCFSSTVVYEEPVVHGAAANDEASSKKARPPEIGHVMVKTLKGETVRIDFWGTSISCHDLKQRLEEEVGASAETQKLMCGSRFVEDYDKISSASRLFMITQVGATLSHT